MNTRRGTSMVHEFKRPEDLEQACYEARVDLSVFIGHINDIAARCRAHFPEVADGLNGSAAGMARYLKGLEGKWVTSANNDLHEVLQQPEFSSHMWAYEFTRDPRAGVMLMGTMAAIASVKPELTFWQALAEARGKLSDWEPLIEQLLAFSPQRKTP